jgi:hypothetical protein
MNRQLMQLVYSFVLAVGLLCFLPARADYEAYNWLVTVETEQIPGQFQYAGSTLQPLVLARVSYTRDDGSEYTPYENLWFCNGKPYGLERFNPLNVGRGESAAIRVTSKSVVPTEWEYKAAAKSIVRVFLDIRVNSSVVQSVILPDESFLPIVNEMENDHFSVFNIPVDVPYQLAALMWVTDVSKMQTRTMCYAPNSAGAISE